MKNRKQSDKLDISWKNMQTLQEFNVTNKIIQDFQTCSIVKHLAKWFLNYTYKKPRICGRVVKVFCGSTQDPNSNQYHTRFLHA